MSRLFAILLFSAALYGQSQPSPLSLSIGPAGDDDVAGGDHPLHFRSIDEFNPSRAPVSEWPEVRAPQPASGSVSLRELEHPIAKKALRATYEAQVLSKKQNIAKAIEKLEEAVRIDPSYRDAHCNLGVQYARVGRFLDARAEFQKALDIGPPAALLYADMALTFTVTGEPGQAEIYARKALELDPESYGAQRALHLASLLNPGTTRPKGF
jgi:tetratricopeptide (TPR) repeat protein